MSWVRLDQSFAEDPRWDGPGADGLALHVAALCYCNRNLTDGKLGRSRVKALFPVADVDATIDALVAAGLCDGDGDVVELVDYLEHQPSAEHVRTQQRAWASKKQRARAHQAGDHSLCTRGRFCPQGALSPGDTPRDSSGESSPSVPNRTDRKGGTERKGATPPAPWGSQGPPPREPKGGFTVVMMPSTEDGGSS